ncbi:MAG: envelope stress response protein PspG [Synergistales bacterium]|nr:envelope stress response protein PspG [Synergistales bacterium]
MYFYTGGLGCLAALIIGILLFSGFFLLGIILLPFLLVFGVVLWIVGRFRQPQQRHDGRSRSEDTEARRHQIEQEVVEAEWRETDHSDDKRGDGSDESPGGP